MATTIDASNNKNTEADVVDQQEAAAVTQTLPKLADCDMATGALAPLDCCPLYRARLTRRVHF